MSDCYTWIDPFAEIARARAAASYAYERGQRSVLAPIEEMGREEFGRRLRLMAADMAQFVAEQEVKPYLADNFAQFEGLQRRTEQKAGRMAAFASPYLEHIVDKGEVGLAAKEVIERDETTMVMSVITREPFRYNVATPLR